MKCWVCEKDYTDEDIKPIFYKDNGKWASIDKINYKGTRLSLCNACRRMIILLILMKNHEIIDFIEPEGVEDE